MILDLKPNDRIEKYIIERMLGAGGMGTVWLARHEALGSLHAIKVLHDSSPEIDVRLRQEGQIQARLQHPNIVRVTDTVEVQGRPGLVLEYIDGPTLAEMLLGMSDSRRVLSIPEVDVLAQGILRGVAAAHDSGWIHRDLKPGNVLVHESDGGLVPKVTDFGLAKVLEGDEEAVVGSASRRGLGTRGYMPLEQLVGLRPDQRVDVFALGALLFELCEGRPAFPTVEAWEASIRGKTYPSPPRADLPDRMRAAIERSLCEREERAATARALLEIWSEGKTHGTKFHPETLHAARKPEDHLTPERLRAEQLTPSEREHIDVCARCRSEHRRGRQVPLVADTWSSETTPKDPSPLQPPPREPASRAVVSPTIVPEHRRHPLAFAPLLLLPLTVYALVGVLSEDPDPVPVIALTPEPVPPEPAPSEPVPPEPAPSEPAPPEPAEQPPAEQPPVEVAAPPPAPVENPRPQLDTRLPPGFLVVNTLGGPSGLFRVDGGPPLKVGPLRKQRLSAGSHGVQLFQADGRLEWEGSIAVESGQERVFCWDLSKHLPCR